MALAGHALQPDDGDDDDVKLTIVCVCVACGGRVWWGAIDLNVDVVYADQVTREHFQPQFTQHAMAENI